MSVAQVGSEVGLYYDAPFLLAAGDQLVTPTGRLYEIESVRVQSRGRHAGRQHLRATVLPPDASCDGTRHELHWYRR